MALNYKVEFRETAVSEGKPLFRADTGDYYHGIRIAFSIPGSPHAILTFPNHWTPSGIADYLNGKVDVGEIVDWRPEHITYAPLFLPGYALSGSPAFAVGDTFPLHGLTPEVLALGKEGAGVKVAICDTGVNVNHPAFAGVKVTGDTTVDHHGHGTHCASTALGPWGIAKKADLHVGLALPYQGGGGSELDIAQAVRRAADAGCKVISLSLGGAPSQVMDSAMDYATARGAITVTACGNSGGNPTPGSPVRASRLKVLAHDRNGVWAGFTDGLNWTLPGRIGANGVQIRAARHSGGDIEFSGTSMATPHIAGMCAVLLGAGLTVDTVVSYLFAHIVSPPGAPGSPKFKADFGATMPIPPTPPPPPEQRYFIERHWTEVNVLDDGSSYPVEWHAYAAPPPWAQSSKGKALGIISQTSTRPLMTMTDGQDERAPDSA